MNMNYLVSFKNTNANTKPKTIQLGSSFPIVSQTKKQAANCKTMLIAQNIRKVKKKKLSFLSEI